ncbi:MAG: hypothetical protein OXQ29_15985, partial [Rhodospirillaceae bacterium]|nr:hypothetical protein [Rhodospirillaceae bacterium]
MMSMNSRVSGDQIPHLRWLSFIACCLPWFFLLAWLTEVSWFLCDDAFISFRYVRNLLEGHGLVFNPGERVEGYSNFLWVLELSVLWGLFGLRPELSAPWLSVACTVGTIAAVLWWAARTPGLEHRRLLAWIAIGLLCSSATFAAWTSAGGLETRQFTLFVVLAVVCLTVRCDSRWGLLAASCSLAAASYTRPEGPLLAVCCIAWFILQRVVARRSLRLDLGELVWLVAPFVVLVAAHSVFRYGYYGEWLPNTYYAKHIRPWYESGFRYLWAATLETGLYLLVPLAVFALREAWRESRDLRHALPLLCIILHAAYVLRIGGDHFEYRPMDFYWPLLAIPASDGILRLGSRVSLFLRHLIPTGVPLRGAARPGPCALFLFAPVVFYASALQGVVLVEGEADRAEWLMAAPGMETLAATANDLHSQMQRHWVAGRVSDHRSFADMRIQLWAEYERME